MDIDLEVAANHAALVTTLSEDNQELRDLLIEIASEKKHDREYLCLEGGCRRCPAIRRARRLLGMS